MHILVVNSLRNIDGNPPSSGTWRTYVCRRRNSLLLLGYFLLVVSFLYFVVAFSPTLVRMGEFFLYGAYKKPTRLLGWIVQINLKIFFALHVDIAF